MPLLGKIRFIAQDPPENLGPDDEVYVCKATGEVFKDYEKFFDQTILCNSLIWTCESTGHNNLTFLEAVESEGNSRKQINSFPRTLHLPILHLVSLTKRTIFKDLLDDIYGFTRDRYFVGEKVSILTETERKNAIVIKVFPVINLGGTGNNGLSNFVTEHEVSADGKKRIVIKSPKKAVIDSSLFQYMSQDVKTGTTIMSTAKNMNRNRNLFNRETCKLFLKEHCEHHCKGIWKLKDAIIKKYNLQNVKFSDYFAGPVPNFSGSENLSNGDMNEVSEKKEAVLNLQKKEQDKKQTEKEWSKQRDDMLCDDLLDLPVPTPLKMSGDDFGNAVMIMEFIYGFKALCELELPNNFNIVSLVESLYEQHSPTLYLDLIQQLLAVIFQMQSGLPELNSSWKAACKYDQDVQDGMVLIKLFQSVSTIKKLKSNKTFNESPLQCLPMDTSSLTELVRLHLLVGDDSSNQSDGFNDIKAEYKASEFSRNYPEIMKKLSVGNILDLKPGEKLVLLANLIEQVLSLPACRDLIEENYNKLKNVQRDLRAHVYAVQRREKDFLNYNLKKKQEEDTMKSHKKTDKPAEQNSANTKKKISILDLKDKDFEEMPVEGIDWDQLSQEEKDHIRNWSTRRQNELQQIVDNLQSECFLTPIGTDRTYRRYWWFRSVPGLFVEDSKVHSWTVPRSCLLPIKQNETRIEMSLRAALSGNKIGSSNEQKSTNTIDKYFIADIKKEITETVNSNKSTSNETAATNSKTLSYMNVNEQLRIRNTVEWSAFNSAQQVDALIERLNRRGYRENLLRTYLINNRDKIVISFSTNANDSSNFSTNKSDISNNIVEHIFDWLLCEQGSITSKNATCDESKPLLNEAADHNNVDAKHKVNNTKSKKSCVEHFGGIAGELELMRCVADMLLDLEERIFAGSLGQLKDLDRDLWRKELECTDEQMKGGQAGLKDEQPCMYSSSNGTVDDDIDVDDAQMRFNKKNLKKMMKMMVDIQQMIEEKYLLPPLGENEETKLKRTKVLEQQQQIEQQDQYHLVQANYGDEMDINTNHVFKGMDIKSKNDYTTGSLTSLNNSTNKLLNKSCVSGGDVSHNGFNSNSIGNNCDSFNNINCLTNDNSGNVNICNDSNVSSSNHFNNSSNLFKWLSCVEGSNNFSHLYLCTVLLDMSIAWSKSALNARCKICRKKKDADLMLLCDGCDQGHHMYCLKPPLKKIPDGDWYCPMCRPKEFSIVVCPRKVTENIKYEDLESDCDDEANESSAATNNVAETGNDGIWALADQDDKTSSEGSTMKNKTSTCKQYSSLHRDKLFQNSKINKSQDKRQTSKTACNNDNIAIRASLCTSTSSTNDQMTNHKSPSTGKLTRSGREIIKPKINDEFIVNQPTVKSRKRNRLSLQEPETQKKSKRQCKSVKYSDDFDYTLEHQRGDDDDDYDAEAFTHAGCDDEDEDYSQNKRKARKSKTKQENVNCEKNKKCKKSSLSVTVKPSNHRQTNTSMKVIEDLVGELMKNDNAWPFLKPVTVKEAPDYFEIINRPMDLSTIKYKIYRFEYPDQYSIIDDLRLMFDNCNLYNSPNTPVHNAGLSLEQYLDQRLEQIENASINGDMPEGKISRCHAKRNSL